LLSGSSATSVGTSSDEQQGSFQRILTTRPALVQVPFRFGKLTLKPCARRNWWR